MVVTPEEFDLIKSKAASAQFQTITDFILSAVEEYSGYNDLRKIEEGKKLSVFYKKYNSDLAHIGGNLNQYMKHCNELAKINSLSAEVLINNGEIINQLFTLIISLQKDLYDITNKISKF